MGMIASVRRWLKLPAADVRNSTAGTAYETAAQTRRTNSWRASTLGPNAALLGNLSTLRDRSRAAVRNDGYAAGAIGKLTDAICGYGIKPLSQAKDPAFRQAIQELWARWVDESDAEDGLGFYGQQSLAVRGWLEGGETFARLRDRMPEDGLSVPLQIQLLEPELCPHDYDRYGSTEKVRAGIRFSPIGKRLGYYFHPSRPELDDWDASTLVYLPAASVVHLYQPLRQGQLRGLPILTQALLDLYELDQYDDAQLVRQKLAAMFAGFVEQSSGAEVDAINPFTGQAPEILNDQEMVTLEPGLMQKLDPGDKVTFTEPPKTDGYADFMRQQLRGAAAAVGLPYEIWTGDMRDVNDRTVRVLLNEFRGRIAAWQYNIVAFKFCRPIWRAWMDRVFLSGALPMPSDYLRNPEAYRSVKWTPPRVPYIQPVQDIEAMRAEVRAGFRSRSDVVSEYGDDAEAIDLEQQLDNQRADSLGLKYDSDGRTPINAAGGKTTEPPDREGAPAKGNQP